jgi:hypothetical protein
MLEAQSLGMSPTEVAEIAAKYGPQVLSVVNSALKNGFSFTFVIECLKLFGPVVLDFVVSLFKEKQEVKVCQARKMECMVKKDFGRVKKYLKKLLKSH